MASKLTVDEIEDQIEKQIEFWQKEANVLSRIGYALEASSKCHALSCLNLWIKQEKLNRHLASIDK